MERFTLKKLVSAITSKLNTSNSRFASEVVGVESATLDNWIRNERVIESNAAIPKFNRLENFAKNPLEFLEENKLTDSYDINDLKARNIKRDFERWRSDFERWKAADYNWASLEKERAQPEASDYEQAVDERLKAVIEQAVDERLKSVIGDNKRAMPIAKRRPQPALIDAHVVPAAKYRISGLLAWWREKLANWAKALVAWRRNPQVSLMETQIRLLEALNKQRELQVRYMEAQLKWAEILSHQGKLTDSHIESINKEFQQMEELFDPDRWNSQWYMDRSEMPLDHKAVGLKYTIVSEPDEQRG